MSTINIPSDITGTVWKILVKPGDKVAEDDSLMILESMKMEIPVTAPEAATVQEICVTEGQTISEGELVAVLKA
ncbi:biotin/lipoyl-binding carrier protein [Bordetella sp. BOR01]|uniref:biotin/lipoyl-binding carrier protein n=1 Tax=Bordetella sp. BOR01 TaxID=2854779 RepID=UPI001C45867D|nr:biotin/lipoyl-binding carrier protein [Bordetella sp. BOR01]MBV7485495.1 biotin/lipoyl-binding carrier protein [Bordetella sp. BOR01]